MKKNHLIMMAGLMISVLVSACATPGLYRPEVELFQKATSEIDSYVKAKQESLTDVRKALRNEVLQSAKPLVLLSPECRQALHSLNAGKPSEAKALNCKLKPDDETPETIFNPSTAIENSIAFTNAVKTYASSLDKLAKSGDKESLKEAAKGLSGSIVSLAGTAAEAAGKPEPDLSILTPIASFIATVSFYKLENQKAKALKEAATQAHNWIKIGAEAVEKVLISAQLEFANQEIENLDEQVSKVNESSATAYLKEVNKAIEQTIELRKLLRRNDGLPLQKLPTTHEKLLQAFKDRKRHLSEAIVVAQDLYKSAQDAYEKIKE